MSFTPPACLQALQREPLATPVILDRNLDCRLLRHASIAEAVHWQLRRKRRAAGTLGVDEDGGAVLARERDAAGWGARPARHHAGRASRRR